MTNLDKADPSAAGAARQPRTWDFAETTLVVLIADGVFTLSAAFGVSVLLAAVGGIRGMPKAQLEALLTQGNWHGAAIIVATPLTIAVLWIAIRMARREFSEYLALNWPSGGEIVRALAIMSILLMVEMSVAAKIGGANVQGNPDLFVGSSIGLLALLVAGCIVGPILEEFVVRGFMYRGWSQSFLGPTGTIVLTSILWAMNHTQYSWYQRFWIFLTGLALGHFRQRTNSTWLPVIAHSALNTFILFTMGRYL